MATMPRIPDIDETYLAMVKAFPLQRIRDDAELDASIAVIDDLRDRPHLTEGEQEYLDALGQLVGAYELEDVQLPNVRGVDVLRHLMEENDLKQADLVDVFGTKSIVAEVLSGKRRLTLGHVRELGSRFGLPADVFID
ncbi:type II toxin-antitoxin system antitoxin HigA [soil metagenome]